MSKNYKTFSQQKKCQLMTTCLSHFPFDAEDFLCMDGTHGRILKANTLLNALLGNDSYANLIHLHLDLYLEQLGDDPLVIQYTDKDNETHGPWVLRYLLTGENILKQHNYARVPIQDMEATRVGNILYNLTLKTYEYLQQVQIGRAHV